MPHLKINLQANKIVIPYFELTRMHVRFSGLSVGFVNDPYQALEDDGIATVTVRVFGDLERELEVRLTTEDLPNQAIGKITIAESLLWGSCYIIVL